MIKIIQGKPLSPSEKKLIIQATKAYENLVYVGPKTWELFDMLYKLYDDDVFVGVCAVNIGGSYAKIGPLCLLSQYHGKGMGKKLVRHIVEDLRSKYNLYLASSNPAVWHIANGLGLKQDNALLHIPLSVIWIYMKMSYYVWKASEVITFCKEFKRKKSAISFSKRHYYLPKGDG